MPLGRLFEKNCTMILWRHIFEGCLREEGGKYWQSNRCIVNGKKIVVLSSYLNNNIQQSYYVDYFILIKIASL